MPPLEKMPPASLAQGQQDDVVSKAKLKFKHISGVPPKHEEPIFLALSYYPELTDIAIEFVFKKIKTTMATRPTIGSYLKRTGNRKYRILINDNKEGFDGILFENIPYNGQIGIVSHELAHIVDFEHRNTWQLLGVGVKFMNKKGRASFEKTIDLLTIYKGMGWQLRDWAACAMGGCPGATPDYVAFKRSNYLSPAEIEKEITKLKIYND